MDKMKTTTTCNLMAEKAKNTASIECVVQVDLLELETGSTSMSIGQVVLGINILDCIKTSFTPDGFGGDVNNNQRS